MPTTITDEITHADTDAVRTEILGLIATAPNRTWTAVALHEHSAHSILDVLMALARLTNEGEIKRTAPGRYTGRRIARSGTGAA